MRRTLYFLVTLFLATPAVAEKRVALVVGNGAYQRAPIIYNPVNDSRAVRDVLTKLGFKVVYGENLDLHGLSTTIGAFASAVDGADVAIAYFAGHGATFGDIPYVVPIDATFTSLPNIPYELVPVETFIGELRRAKGIRIAILDACRDNKAELQLKRLAPTREVATSQGLAKIRDAEGLIVAYSTQYMTTASDGVKDGHSPFTAAILRNIATPNLDVTDLFVKVAREVRTATGGRQTPEISLSLFDTYYLGGDVEKVAVSTSPPPRANSSSDFGASSPNAIGTTNKLDLTPPPLASVSSKEVAVLDQNESPAVSSPTIRDSQFYENLKKTLTPPCCYSDPIAALTVVSPLPLHHNRRALIEACDRLASAPTDPGRPHGVPGVAPKDIDVATAVPACRTAVGAWTNIAEGGQDGQRMLFELARALRAGGKDGEAKQLYEMAAAAGYAAAINNLGVLSVKGKGGTSDYAAARSWYEKAAAAGLAEAATNLGRLYELGEGVAQDYGAARSWYEKAAEGGSSDAMTYLADLYSYGRGVGRDNVVARGLYEKAAAAGNADAMICLGNLYEMGLGGVKQSHLTARSWYENAAKAGNAKAMKELGDSYSWGIDADIAVARSWYERSANQGNAGAMTALGELYAGGDGVRMDLVAAQHWFEQAAKAGDAEGMYRLGVTYLVADPDLSLDFNLARIWLLRAADAGNKDAMQRLGELYERGEGVETDFKAARGWYEKASAYGSSNASSNLRRLGKRGF